MEQQTGEDIMELSFSFDMSEFVKEGLFKEKKEIFSFVSDVNFSTLKNGVGLENLEFIVVENRVDFSDLEDARGMSNLKSIESFGDHYLDGIYFNSLKSLDGLDNLEYVSGIVLNFDSLINKDELI